MNRLAQFVPLVLAGQLCACASPGRVSTQSDALPVQGSGAVVASTPAAAGCGHTGTEKRRVSARTANTGEAEVAARPAQEKLGAPVASTSASTKSLDEGAAAGEGEHIYSAVELFQRSDLEGSIIRVRGYALKLGVCEWEPAIQAMQCNRAGWLELGDLPPSRQKASRHGEASPPDRVRFRETQMDLITARPFVVGRRYVITGRLLRRGLVNEPAILRFRSHQEQAAQGSR